MVDLVAPAHGAGDRLGVAQIALEDLDVEPCQVAPIGGRADEGANGATALEERAGHVLRPQNRSHR